MILSLEGSFLWKHTFRNIHIDIYSIDIYSIEYSKLVY